MNNTFGLCLAAFLAGVIAGAALFHYAGCGAVEKQEEEKVVFRNIVTTDTILIEKKTELERVKPVFSVDTVWVTVEKDGPEGGLLQPQPVYEAVLDTVMFDSLLTLGVKYSSPVPLDARGWFTLRAGLNERRIIEKETVFIKEEERGTVKWLHFGLVIAPGYGFLEKKTDIFIGMGIMAGL